ncbi:MAG: SCO family protein, partial [Pseudomonadota bacterium]
SKNRVITSGQALIGGPFELVGKDGKTVTDKDFLGRHMLVFFGFTHCPDICPAELQVMSAALDNVGSKADQVVPVFITVDPERDTPELMAAYVENFGPNFVGLTGSPEAVADAAKAYRVVYQKFQAEGAGGTYSIDHSALVYLMGPDGKFVTHFPYGTSPEKMAETLRRYL